ncbi:MAG: enoyl-CoA hydratase/isomerase family protein [Myxococcota bacterium]|nr:enoyl-CoA hydratase/isomerase family protein [Myxococcota bacterium]
MYIKFQKIKKIAIIFLDRPQKAHAYNQELLTQLQSEFREASRCHSVLVLSSTGNRHFCAGADLNEMKQKTANDALNMLSQKVFDEIASSPTITIAALKGPAVAGGMELALACDLRVVSPNTYWKLPEVSLGLIPSAGGCTRLPELIGRSRANAVILGGESIDAQSSLNWGIANRLHENPEEEAIRWALEIAEYDPLALRLAKQVLRNPSLESERLAEAILYEKQDKSAQK